MKGVASLRDLTFLRESGLLSVIGWGAHPIVDVSYEIDLDRVPSREMHAHALERDCMALPRGDPITKTFRCWRRSASRSLVHCCPRFCISPRVLVLPGAQGFGGVPLRGRPPLLRLGTGEIGGPSAIQAANVPMCHDRVQAVVSVSGINYKKGTLIGMCTNIRVVLRVCFFFQKNGAQEINYPPPQGSDINSCTYTGIHE